MLLWKTNNDIFHAAEQLKMASDVHAHPRDLLNMFPGAEKERCSLNIACAASSCSIKEYSFHEKLAQAAGKEGNPPLYLCFAIHPQLPASITPASGANQTETMYENNYENNLEFLASLASEGRIAAIGETGFDLYSTQFRETEKIQDELFAVHLELALRYNLPLILHVRRAMHKIFLHTRSLKALPAVIFHSWPGVPDEAFSLLRKGIRAFFSFGTTLLLNHKNAIQSCAALPSEHLLLETDAPYQPLRGNNYSSWKDLSIILAEAVKIRKGGVCGEKSEIESFEQIVDSNFFKIFEAFSKPTEF